MLEPKVAKDHQYYQDLVGGAAIGILTPEEYAELEAYMRTSDGESLREELAEFRAVVDAIPLSLDAQAPSPELRDRIEAMIAPEAIDRELPSATTPPALFSLPTSPLAPPETLSLPTPLAPRRQATGVYLAVAAALIIAIVAGALVGRYLLSDNDTTDKGQEFALSFANPAPDESAKLTYYPDRQLFVLNSVDLPALPDNKVYQVWLIGASGAKPVGTVNGSEYATVADIDQFQ
ncbi:MAG TPA: anti-sigma factor, partial [Thermomicrobiales bacterium]|nr:anti-sigma factor [Thermomicrobiales bacterium]